MSNIELWKQQWTQIWEDANSTCCSARWLRALVRAFALVKDTYEDPKIIWPPEFKDARNLRNNAVHHEKNPTQAEALQAIKEIELWWWDHPSIDIAPNSGIATIPIHDAAIRLGVDDAVIKRYIWAFYDRSRLWDHISPSNLEKFERALMCWELRGGIHKFIERIDTVIAEIQNR